MSCNIMLLNFSRFLYGVFCRVSQMTVFNRWCLRTMLRADVDSGQSDSSGSGKRKQSTYGEIVQLLKLSLRPLVTIQYESNDLSPTLWPACSKWAISSQPKCQWCCFFFNLFSGALDGLSLSMMLKEVNDHRENTHKWMVIVLEKSSHRAWRARSLV